MKKFVLILKKYGWYVLLGVGFVWIIIKLFCKGENDILTFSTKQINEEKKHINKINKELAKLEKKKTKPSDFKNNSKSSLIKSVINRVKKRNSTN